MIAVAVEGDQLVISFGGLDMVSAGRRRLAVSLDHVYEADSQPPFGGLVGGIEHLPGPGINCLHKGKPWVEIVLGGTDYTFLRLTVADPEATTRLVQGAARGNASSSPAGG